MIIFFLEVPSHGKALLFMHCCNFKFIIRSLELCCAEMSHHIISQKSWTHNHTNVENSRFLNSLNAKSFLSVRHIMWHNDDMVDTRLQGCDALLIGLSWTAETRTVGGHKLYFYVSARLTTVHISVVVSNFYLWDKKSINTDMPQCLHRRTSGKYLSLSF